MGGNIDLVKFLYQKGIRPNIFSESEITIITIIKMVYLFYPRNRQTVVSMVRIGKR
jgi:hypothetical protein